MIPTKNNLHNHIAVNLLENLLRHKKATITVNFNSTPNITFFLTHKATTNINRSLIPFSSDPTTTLFFWVSFTVKKFKNSMNKLQNKELHDQKVKKLHYILNPKFQSFKMLQ